ncbi:MAG: hypothetical protein QXD55_01720 [Candidatus Aenigmatarchaeota archaeon]
MADKLISSIFPKSITTKEDAWHGMAGKPSFIRYFVTIEFNSF